jgi:hypothetical protein
MSLDVNAGRQVFADYLQGNFHKSKSLDAALMAVIEWAYRKGLADAAADRQGDKAAPP